ncbi:hypothetical protein, partial [Streptococcus pneumoniae]|uniref:hypothetical protein n=1 Tax=Streptococcus pneumoniae TaxID=1313 RepID=UPI001C71AA4D
RPCPEVGELEGAPSKSIDLIRFYFTFFIIISLNSTESGGVFWLYFRLLGTILKIIFRYFSVFFGFWSGNWRGLFEILVGIFLANMTKK